jgi:sulfatase modifying factor 1
MELEYEFDVTSPSDPPNSAYKSVFTRQPFRLSDMAELIYLQQGSGKPQRKLWRQAQPVQTPISRCAPCSVPFTQLDGHWDRRASNELGLFEPLDTDTAFPQYRRRSDGMRCIVIPSASVEIGCDSVDALSDEYPKHLGLPQNPWAEFVSSVELSRP